MQLSWNVRAMMAAIVMIVMPWLLHAQQAQIRATHLGVGVADLDVYIASDTASFYGLPAGSASAVSSLNPGTVRVRIAEHNIPSPLFYDEQITLQANRRTNILIFGTEGDLEFKTINLPTNAGSIPIDSAYIRFVNGAPGTPSVDIRIKDSYGKTTTVTGLTYTSNSIFYSIPRGTADIQVFAAGSSTPLFSARNDFPGSSRSTIFVTGQAGSGAGLKLQLMNELPLSAQQPIRVLQAPSARLRAVHTVPDGPAIDIYADGTSAVSDLAFRDASALISTTGGAHTVGVTAAGQPIGSAIINLNLNLSVDSVYTAFAAGTLTTTPSLVMVARPAHLSVSADSALIRIVHVAPEAGNVDVNIETAAGSVEENNVAFKSATPYRRIPKGSIMVAVRATGGAQLYRASGDIEGGSIITIIASGMNSDMQLNVLHDTRTDAQIPMAALTATAVGKLRAVHLSPDAPDVDIYINDDANNPMSLGFREASMAKGDLNAGPVNVKIGLAGTGIGAALINRDFQIAGEATTTAFAVGKVSTLSLDVVTLITTAENVPQQGQVLMRFLHAAPDAGSVDIEFTPSSGQKQRFNNIAFKGTVPYMIVPPGMATAVVYATGSTTPMLSVEGSLEADGVLTAILSGTAAAGNLGMNILVDNVDASQVPMILLTNVVVTSVPFTRDGNGSMAIAPNPVRGNAQISYTQDHPGAVKLALYDQLGRRVATAEPASREKGDYTMTFSTTLLPAGIYNAVLTGADGTHIGSEKLVVVK